MKLTTNRPCYNAKPIRSVGALSRALATSPDLLRELAATASSRYRLAKKIVKPDGSVRQPFDALEPLKTVHRAIKTELLSPVFFPKYLTGSLQGTDYRANASLHVGAKIVICEDIQQFFPTTTEHRVFDIWRGFVGFSREVAELLTSITTKDGVLPQGAIISSYLANLAFWRDEPHLQETLSAEGIVYSRYVDDVTVSSKQRLSKEQQTKLIARIYGMLRKHGYHAKRRKHEVFSARRAIVITKLVSNVRPALTSKERARIRTAVFQLEKRVSGGERSLEIRKELDRVAGRVGKLKRFHDSEGVTLTRRVRFVREILIPRA